MSREIRCFEYVNHPYDAVRSALTSGAPEVFSQATSSAASRAEGVAAGLRINIAGLEIGKEIEIQVGEAVETEGSVSNPPTTTLPVEWEASHAPRLFPVMKAEVSLYPLTATETQIDFLGHYEPPMGALGTAMNAVAGHRIAEASVHRFVRDVARYLRETLKGDA